MADSYSLLLRDRDQAAYRVVGAATVAVAFLNLAEDQKALRTLLSALTEFQLADSRISDFHREAIYHGNRTAAA